MRKSTLSILPAGLLVAMASISTDALAQSNREERACVDEVEREYHGRRNARVVDSSFSQAATEVIVDAEGERWRCIVWSDGRVQDLTRISGSGSRHDYGGNRYEPHGGGVTLYHDYDYRGGSETVHGDIPDMARSRLGNDALSSIRVPRGCRAVLFSDNNYRGRSVALNYDEPNLGRTRVGNDSVSSIEVDCGGEGYYSGSYSGSHGSGVVLHRDVDFRGGTQAVYGDIPDLAHTQIGTDSLSSIEVPRGCWVTLYEHNNYRGRSEEFNGDVRDLSRTRVGNDTVSSMRVDCR